MNCVDAKFHIANALNIESFPVKETTENGGSHLDPRIDVMISVFENDKDETRFLPSSFLDFSFQKIPDDIQTSFAIRIPFWVEKHRRRKEARTSRWNGDPTGNHLGFERVNETTEGRIRWASDSRSAVLDDKHPPFVYDRSALELHVKDVPAAVLHSGGLTRFVG